MNETSAVIKQQMFFILYRKVVSLMKLMKIEDFINVFRELERVIRDNFQESQQSSSPVAFYESVLGAADKSNYLTHLRQKRNIIVHNAVYADKIAVTDFDIDFLNSIIYDINAEKGIVKDFYKPFKSLPAVSETDTVKTLCDVYKSKKMTSGDVYVLNADKTKIGVISASAILSEIADGKRMTSKVSTLQGIVDMLHFVDVSAPISVVAGKRPIPVVNHKKLVGLLF